MRVGVLTSSRADYGIYLPLLRELKKNTFFDLKLIAFGTHLSAFHGATIDQIEENGFHVDYKIETVPKEDSPFAIANSIGNTINIFSSFWNENRKRFDLVFCLGDRYEMYAAVTAGIPFQIPFAHLHGGETTLGAIDNIFRHTITLASQYHFAATQASAERIKELIQSDENVYSVGSLSLDNINDIDLLTIDEFKSKWEIDLNYKTILTTFHPETIALEHNRKFANEIIEVLNELVDYQVLITMPNADTSGNLIRKLFKKEFESIERIHLIENLGSQSYFTALKYCSFLMGNTSSGIIEAASFGKYVINLGDRQKGRICGKNVLQIAIDKQKILKSVKQIEVSLPQLTNENIYFQGGAAKQIIQVLISQSL